MRDIEVANCAKVDSLIYMRVNKQCPTSILIEKELATNQKKQESIGSHPTSLSCGCGSVTVA